MCLNLRQSETNMAELKTLLKEHPNLAIKERKDGKSQV